MLSMWRGYGGNGSGAALVLDTNELEDLGDSPLILAPVYYASVEQRLEWIDSKLSEFAQLLKQAAAGRQAVSRGLRSTRTPEAVRPVHQTQRL
jgi:hypothetical protein